MTSSGARNLSILAACLLLAVACSSETPEQKVLRLIDRAEAAVRDKNLGALGEMVSEQYRDPQGLGKREVLGIARFQLQQYPSIHTLKRVAAIRPVGDSSLEAEVLVAAADVEIRDRRSIESVSADLLLFHVVFTEESGGDWRITSARWKQAEPADFLGLTAP